MSLHLIRLALLTTFFNLYIYFAPSLQEFPSKKELIEHVSAHGKLTPPQLRTRLRSVNPAKPWKCELCYKSFASEDRLQVRSCLFIIGKFSSYYLSLGQNFMTSLFMIAAKRHRNFFGDVIIIVTIFIICTSPCEKIEVEKFRRVWFEYVSNMGEMRNEYKILFDEPEGKRPLARPGHRWENNIKVGLKEIVCEDVDWIHLA
jgi:hypothetical protein